MDRIGDFINLVDSISPGVEAIFFSNPKSREKAIAGISEMDTALNIYITAIERWCELMNPWLQAILAAPDMEYEQSRVASDYDSKFQSIFYNRASKNDLIRWRDIFKENGGIRFFKRADFKHEDVKTEEAKLAMKCQVGGDYNNRLSACATKMNIFVQKLQGALRRAEGQQYRMKGLGTLIDAYNWIIDEISSTGYDFRNVLRMKRKNGYPWEPEKPAEATKAASESWVTPV